MNRAHATIALPVFSTALALGGCTPPVKTEANSVDAHVVINQVKKELTGLYNAPLVFEGNGPGCDGTPNKIVLTPTATTLSLKSVSGTKSEVGGGLASPVTIIKFDPSVSGSDSEAASRSVEVKFGVPKGLSAKPIDGTTACGKDEKLCSVVTGIVAEMLKVDHRAKPCLPLSTLKAVILFDAVKTGTTGFGVELVVIKVSDKTTFTSEYHQALQIEFNLEGSALQIK